MKRQDIAAMQAALGKVGRPEETQVEESVEQIDELSKKTLGSYIKSAKQQTNKASAMRKAMHGKNGDAHLRKQKNRATGVDKAVDRLTKEDVGQLDELSKKTLGSYAKKAGPEYGNRVALQGRYPDASKKSKDDMKRKTMNRRKGFDKAMNKLTKESLSPLERYKLKIAEAAEVKEPIHKTTGPALSQQSSKEVKQSKETSSTKDTGKLDKESKPAIIDADKAIMSNKASEKKSAMDATKNSPVQEEALTEDYHRVQMKYLNKMVSTANEIASTAAQISKGHDDAMAAQKRISAAYAAGKEPSDKDRKLTRGSVYDCKYVVRTLEDALDELIRKLPGDMNEESSVGVEASPVREQAVSKSRFGNVAVMETRKPISMRDALAMMESRDEHTKGATPPQAYDDNWSGKAKQFANKHKVDDVDVADVNKAMDKNKREVGLSLQRAVDYRHNDNRMGDKKPVGNDGK